MCLILLVNSTTNERAFAFSIDDLIDSLSRADGRKCRVIFSSSSARLVA
jgi:hypothetical protein